MTQVPPPGLPLTSSDVSSSPAAGSALTSLGEPAPALAVCGVSKRFGTVQANDRVSFEVAPASIHAVVGENGAGKTTLMRIVYGLYAPDSGHIELDGQSVAFNSPRDALSHGVGMVHQHSLLVNSLTIAENVLLASRGLRRPPRQQTLARLRSLSEANHLRLDPTMAVGKLSVGARQRAEILSALYHGARLLILDEPTTVLTPREVDELFVVMRRLRDRGATIMLVTHKLVEVMTIADRITVLRAGGVVGTVMADQTTDRSLVRMMVGRDVPSHAGEPGARRAAPAGGDPLLQVQALTVHDANGISRVHDASFDVYPGEIVAITGVEGNGQVELTEALVGLRPITSGNVRLRNHAIRGWSVDRRRKVGLAYIPESRVTEGINPFLSVRDNLILGRHNQRPYARFGLRNLGVTTRLARALVADYDVVTSSTDSYAATLSGGNLQKVVVAREVSKSPRLLIAAQPTQGVDVAAAHMIRTTLLNLRDQGIAIILVSSDLNEVCDLADRAIVLYNGTVYGHLQRQDLSEEAIGTRAMGLRA